ncbi:MAG: cbb3-type cytochrome c oxidase subunit II [Chthoniobacterales bacterium]
MKGLLPLILGIFGTFAFSWLGLTVIPNAQIGHLDPQTDEDGNDPYPAPKSGMAEHGRQVYVANGCVYCHSQQVRADYAASDIERKWGERRSAPRDYIFERPVQLGKMRMGPDLANIGKRAPSVDENAPAPAATGASPAAASPVPVASAPANAAAPAPGTAIAVAPAEAAAPVGKSPAATATTAVANAATSVKNGAAAPAAPTAPTASPAAPAPGAETPDTTTMLGKNGEPLAYTAAWHHQHLYAPRSISRDSNMPSFRFLYETRRIGGERAADAVVLNGEDAPPAGWEIVPTYDAQCLVAYLMSLDQSHPLKEVKSAGPAAPAVPGKAVK